MDFLTQQEVSGFKQDIARGKAKQDTEKIAFEKKLLNGLGNDMENRLEHPEKANDVNFAKKYTRKKKKSIWIENFKTMLGFGNKNKQGY